MNTHLTTALRLAAAGVPVMPLSAEKRPVANCPACTNLACDGRPNMKTPGPCTCLAPCHAWAATTTDPDTLTAPAWASAWRQAGAVAYHPGGAGLTVVDLDHADAIAWARRELPATRTVPTTRGEHWIYLGAMPSANGVRSGIDVKSVMQYARWLGSGTGTMTVLPDVVRRLVVKEETTSPRGGVVSSPPDRAAWDHRVATGCRHTERYVRTGLERGLALVRARRESGAGSQAFGVAQFIAKQHANCPGPCGLDVLGQQLITTAVSMGVPEPYAARAVANGLAGAA
ncbi:bifunctional DNA primase/polymerase [Streptomyces globisporus]|uniref:bifunctional DNA primase/polymerase n=1 Tax=Streptomyces globisporus TaxID=1908 RepID=UPI0037A39AA3